MVAAPSVKKKLLEDLAQIAKQEIENQGSAVANIINKAFAELQQILEKRKQQLLQEATGKVSDKVEKLGVQEKHLSLA